MMSCSAGGVSVCAGRLGGRGLAHRSGALRVQQRPRTHCGRGGETHQEARGLREVHRHLGRALLRTRTPHYGMHEQHNGKI